VFPFVVGALMFLLCRRPGAGLLFLGLLVLGGATLASCDSDGPSLAVFPVGVALSVCLGWAGCKIQSRRPRDFLADEVLAVMATLIPSAREIQPNEMHGVWQFYVDAVVSMVAVDLRPDGSYTETIVDHHGGRIDCPGGRWTLDGPYIELTSYHSATQAVTQTVRWFFADGREGLALLASDDPECETRLLAVRSSAAIVGA
jgi:hypothetical protein